MDFILFRPCPKPYADPMPCADGGYFHIFGKLCGVPDLLDHSEKFREKARITRTLSLQCIKIRSVWSETCAVARGATH